MVTDGSGEVGAAKLTNEVLMIMSSVPTTVKNMTGVDITQQLSRSGLTGSRVSLVIISAEELRFFFLIITNFHFFVPVSITSLYENSLNEKKMNERMVQR